MKKLIVVLGLLMVCAAGEPARSGGHGAVSFGFFYSSLGSEGEWIPVGGSVYGWRPIGVAAGWRPYLYGRWAWTDDGWFWVSDEPWGWAVFHYGRWYYDDYYGWIWVPGYDWAPAWVEWRYGGPYVGWAPLSPYAVFGPSFGVRYSSHWVTPVSYWTFVDCRYVTSPSLHRYIYRSDNNTRYFGRTRSAGDVRYEGGRIITRGPERQYIEQRGNIRIDRAVIADAPDRVQTRILRQDGQDRIEVYRPKIEARTAQEMNERPERVREDNRKIPLEIQHTDAGGRGAIRETNREVTPRNETVTPRADQRRVERAPAPAESRPSRKIEKRQDRTTAPERRKEEQRQGVGRNRQEQAPRIEGDATRKPEQRRESVERPRIQRERPAQSERVAPRQESRRQAAMPGPQKGETRVKAERRGEGRGR